MNTEIVVLKLDLNVCVAGKLELVCMLIDISSFPIIQNKHTMTSETIMQSFSI